MIYMTFNINHMKMKLLNYKGKSWMVSKARGKINSWDLSTLTNKVYIVHYLNTYKYVWIIKFSELC